MVVFNSKLLLANIYGRLTRLTAAFGIYQWPGKATGETPRRCPTAARRRHSDRTYFRFFT